MTAKTKAWKTFCSSIILWLVISSIGFPPTRCAGNPADPTELSEAWQEYLDDQGEYFWGEVSQGWKAFPALKVDVGLQSEQSTRQLVYSPPYLLNKVALRRDQEPQRDVVDGGNPDYRFRVSKDRESGSFVLKWLGQPDASPRPDRDFEFSFRTLASQFNRLPVSVGAVSLVEVLEQSPEAFSLSTSTDGVSELRYERSSAKSLGKLAGLERYSDGVVTLSAGHPWLPTRTEFRYDVEGEDRFIEKVKFQYEPFCYSSTNFDLDGAKLVEQTYKINPIEPNDPETVALMRVSAYGLPEPAISKTSTRVYIIVLVVGLLMLVGGVVLLKKRREAA